MNCKPGDLAILTKAVLSENIGRIVEVLGPADEHPKLGFRWHVKPQSPIKTVNGNDLTTRCEPSVSNIATPDAWMRPVSGLPVHDEHREEITA